MMWKRFLRDIWRLLCWLLIAVLATLVIPLYLGLCLVTAFRGRRDR